jgi:hypothetical protein
MRELSGYASEAAPILVKVLEKKPSLDLKNRVEELLKRGRNLPPANRLRVVRALEVLERIATPEARQVLATLAEGDADAWLTRESKTSLLRLTP